MASEDASFDGGSRRRAARERRMERRAGRALFRKLHYAVLVKELKRIGHRSVDDGDVARLFRVHREVLGEFDLNGQWALVAARLRFTNEAEEVQFARADGGGVPLTSSPGSFPP